MRVKSIVAKIEKLREIVALWGEESSPASIERDIAIDYVKEIYELLRFSTDEEVEVAEAEVAEVEVAEVAEAEIEVEAEIEIQETPEVETPEESSEESKKMRLKKILSLYKEEESEEESAPEPEPTPEPEPEPEPEIQTSRALLDTLTLNDRLLLSNELFGGDTEEMERLVLVLGAISTLDDALIYIAQRYKWRGDNEGAKLLFSLLKNRYLQI